MTECFSRSRRVKCDETKPTCLRCRKADRKCRGYAQLNKVETTQELVLPGSVDSHSAPTFDLGLVTPGDSDERRYFNYFCHRVLEDFNGYFSSGFWDLLVLQLSYSEQAVWHAVIALASMHERSVQRLMESRTTSLKLSYTTEQYTKALFYLRNGIENGDDYNLIAVLTCCILFIALEVLQGNYDSALLHLQNGFKIWCQAERSTESSSSALSTFGDEFIEVLLRMNVQANSLLRPALQEYNPLTDRGLPDVPDCFADLAQARHTLTELLNAGFSIFQLAAEDVLSASSTLLARVVESVPTAVVKSKMAQLCGLVSRWRTSFEAVLQNPSNFLTPRDIKAASILKIHYICTSIILNTCISTDDGVLDDYISDFRQLVSLSQGLIAASGWAKSPSFSIDMEIVAPLYFTVISCRDPSVRREALDLLTHLPRHEGVWNAAIAAQVGAWAISIEEAGLAEVKAARDIPVGSRIRRFHAETVVGEKRIRLTPEFPGLGNEVDDHAPKSELSIDWKNA